MSNYQTILYQKQRRGVLITLHRPNALNAMNQEMMNELDSAALAEAEKDAEIRAVITGAGGAFSVGEDISGDDGETAWPYGIPANSSLNATYNKFRDADRKDILGRQLHRWQYPKPIVGVVSGWCLGAASWLALTCHVTIAADDAAFGQPQVRHGANTDFIWIALAGFEKMPCATRSPVITSMPRKRCASAWSIRSWPRTSCSIPVSSSASASRWCRPRP